MSLTQLHRVEDRLHPLLRNTLRLVVAAPHRFRVLVDLAERLRRPEVTDVYTPARGNS